MTIKELKEDIAKRIERLEKLYEEAIEEKDVKFVEDAIKALNDTLYSLENISDK